MFMYLLFQKIFKTLINCNCTYSHDSTAGPLPMNNYDTELGIIRFWFSDEKKIFFFNVYIKILCMYQFQILSSSSFLPLGVTVLVQRWKKIFFFKCIYQEFMYVPVSKFIFIFISPYWCHGFWLDPKMEWWVSLVLVCFGWRNVLFFFIYFFFGNKDRGMLVLEEEKKNLLSELYKT